MKWNQSLFYIAQKLSFHTEEILCQFYGIKSLVSNLIGKTEQINNYTCMYIQSREQFIKLHRLLSLSLHLSLVATNVWDLFMLLSQNQLK